MNPVHFKLGNGPHSSDMETTPDLSSVNFKVLNARKNQLNLQEQAKKGQTEEKNDTSLQKQAADIKNGETRGQPDAQCPIQRYGAQYIPLENSLSQSGNPFVQSSENLGGQTLSEPRTNFFSAHQYFARYMAQRVRLFKLGERLEGHDSLLSSMEGEAETSLDLDLSLWAELYRAQEIDIENRRE